MRGDYYVVPPNGARIRMGAQDYLASRVTRVPDLIGGPWTKVSKATHMQGEMAGKLILFFKCKGGTFGLLIIALNRPSSRAYNAHGGPSRSLL